MTNYEQFLCLVKENRSYRRFDQRARISEEQVKRWVELARYTPSGRNLQPLKYAISTEETTNLRIFEQLAWAGYLKDWKGPQPGEQPSAYIAVLKDKTISETTYCDDGIAVQTILLGAVTDGFGGCTIGSFNKAKTSAILRLPDHLEILWILALGKPAEKVVLEDLDGEDIRYWRDMNEVHHVPKRTLDELIFKPQ
jgi:nitroreductase